MRPASILEQWLVSQVLCFRFSNLLMCLGKQQWMAQVIGSWPFTVEILDTSLNATAIWEMEEQMEDLCLLSTVTLILPIE